MMVHLVPAHDTGPHRLDVDCPCRGEITKEVSAEGLPIFRHKAWDCREAREEATGKGKPNKPWAVIGVKD